MNIQKQQREEVKYAFDIADDGVVRPMRRVRSNMVAELPPRVYRLVVDQTGPHLVPENDFNMPARVYGTSNTYAQRFIRAYELGTKNLGALLIGLPGSGKTLTLKHVAMLAVQAMMPAIIVNTAISGQILTQFLSTITQQCVVCMDEFDKKYGGKDSDGDSIPLEMQDSILELLDGATVGEKKMFILTANDDGKISPLLKDRPSRIRYTIKYAQIDQDTVIDYVSSNLKNCTEDHIRAFLMVANADRMSRTGMNFDSMVELVNEMNYFECSLDEALELMLRNGKESFTSFNVKVFREGVWIDTSAGFGSHNGVYMTNGDYVLTFQMVVPSTQEDVPAQRYEVRLTADHFVGFAESRSAFEFKLNEFTFMLDMVDQATASRNSTAAKNAYEQRPDVIAYKEQKQKEKEKEAAEKNAAENDDEDDGLKIRRPRMFGMDLEAMGMGRHHLTSLIRDYGTEVSSDLLPPAMNFGAPDPDDKAS